MRTFELRVRGEDLLDKRRSGARPPNNENRIGVWQAYPRPAHAGNRARDYRGELVAPLSAPLRSGVSTGESDHANWSVVSAGAGHALGTRVWQLRARNQDFSLDDAL